MSRANRLRAALPALLLAALAASCTADDRQDRVTRLIAEDLRDDGAGLAVGIYRNGEPLYERGFGLADLEHRTRISTGTRFHVASVSKHFTAVAILLLEQEGRLSLDDDVRDYLPRVPGFGETITIRDLVHHTSGLRDQWLLFNLSGQTFDDHLPQEQVLNLVSRQEELNFSPGSNYAYSNTGYTLLAEIVAAVSGQSFSEFAKERIFEPLGMRDSLFYDDVSELLPGRAHSYRWHEDEQRWGRVLLNYETVGATSMFTTVADMGRWARNFSDPRVGGPALVATLSSTAPGRLEGGRELDYGYGLVRESVRGHRAFLHGGADAAFRALFAWIPERDFAVVVLANTPFDRTDLLERIVDVYLGDTPDGADRGVPEEVDLPPDFAAGLAGSYLPDNGRMITFEERDGTLYRKEAGSGAQPLVYRQDGSFDTGFPSRNWRYYRVGREENGRAATVTEHRPGNPSSRTIPHRRIEPVTREATELAEYTGWYYSAELDTSYRLSLAEGGLVASAIWSPDRIRLQPVLVDRFDTDVRLFGSVGFERDDAGAVTGLRVLLGRFNRILFRKVGAGTVPETALAAGTPVGTARPE